MLQHGYAKRLDVPQFRERRGAAEGSSPLCTAQQLFSIAPPEAAEGRLGFREGIPSVETHRVNRASGTGAEVGVLPSCCFESHPLPTVPTQDRKSVV